MGGSGAKERRKLQRQQKGTDAEAKNVPHKRGGSLGSSNSVKFPKPGGWSQKADGRQQVFEKSPDNKGNQHYGGKDKTNGKKENKFQKPKHLKRKLEQAIANHDDNDNSKPNIVASASDKDKILDIMHQWEGQKKKHVARTKREQISRKGQNKTNTMSNRPKTETTKQSNSSDDNTQQEASPLEVVDKPLSAADTTKTLKEDNQSHLIDTVDKNNVDEQPPTTEKRKRRRGRNDPSKNSSDKEQSDKPAAPVSVSYNDTMEVDPNKANDTILSLDSEKKSVESNDGNNKTVSDSDSGDDNVDETTEKRQRGKRRRGRQDTSNQEKEESQAECRTLTSNKDADTHAKKTERKNKKQDGSDKRYCIGRKPVTDFTIGQVYTGKVVYVKPFGIFLDIGCHSDAFCHVSRLRDDYVESPEKLFHEGDEVTNVRVVEIDRTKKRITVSLQSIAMVEREQASLESRKLRRENLASKSKQKHHTKEQVNQTVKHHHHGNIEESKERLPPSPLTTSPKRNHQKFAGEEERDVSNENGDKDFASNNQSAQKTTQPSPLLDKPESEMTPAELKRARKIARRAARRAVNGEDGDE